MGEEDMKQPRGNLTLPCRSADLQRETDFWKRLRGNQSVRLGDWINGGAREQEEVSCLQLG